MRNRKEHCNELRQWAGWDEDLRSAIDAYEREPQLLQEIEQLRAGISAVVNAIAGGTDNHGAA